MRRLVLLLLVLVVSGCAGMSSQRTDDARAYYHMAPGSRAFVMWQTSSPF